MTVSVENRPLPVIADDIATVDNVQKSYQVEQAILPTSSTTNNNKSTVTDWSRTVQTVAAAAAVAVAGWDAHVPHSTPVVSEVITITVE